ncbi:DUF4389 domain-containing protein [Streptomyces sp. x-80]|uniref:DUF4389 domain-containing protein n=1 Tax=Streptomyces sp. x-80 TaxID=2789282 RepID=UPI00397EBEFD
MPAGVDAQPFDGGGHPAGKELTVMATIAAVYRPVRLEGELDEPLSRWLWLVKWLLLFPHHIALILLWISFLIASAIASFAIFFTGRYPHVLFRFTTGVLRWTWRVAFYSYAALATDRYPPFSLGAVPDYPARLHIPYPEQLPRGSALVTSWLRAAPHYVLIALFFLAFRLLWWLGGLSAFLALVVAVIVLFTCPAGILAFTGRYPRRQFNALMAFDRWLGEVIAYMFLLTVAYPPIRPNPAPYPDPPDVAKSPT